MSRSGYWPATEKRWASDGLVIGWSPSKRAVESEYRTAVDTIVLQNSPFKAIGRTGSQKVSEFQRNRGDFSFTPEGVDQYVRTDCAGELIYVGFDPSFRQQFVDELAPSTSLDDPLLEGRSLLRYDEVSGLLMDFLISDGFGGRLRGEALASILLTGVINQFDGQSIADVRHHLPPQKLQLTIEFIDAHSGDNISVDTLAELAGVSKFHFTRMFKLETGLSPYQYVLRHRLRKAQGLLVNSQNSLAEIALSVGFSSQSHMNETFMRVMGVTPGHYRDTVRK